MSFRKKKMLLASSEELACLVSFYFRRNCWEVEVINTFLNEGVINKLSEEEYDILICDLFYLGCEGYDIFKKIRSKDNLKNLAIVVLLPTQISEKEMTLLKKFNIFTIFPYQHPYLWEKRINLLLA